MPRVLPSSPASPTPTEQGLPSLARPLNHEAGLGLPRRADVLLLAVLGNTVANAVLEGNVRGAAKNFKSSAKSSLSDKRLYIQAKCVFVSKKQLRMGVLWPMVGLVAGPALWSA